MHAYIITGASRGLGHALACHVAGLGHAVAGIARQASLSLEGDDIIAIDADLAGPDAANAVRYALQLLPLTDCSSVTLINNAGTVAPIALAGHYPDEQVAQALTLNLVTPILTTNAFLAATAGLALSRRVLNISSGAARSAYPGWGVYGAGKAGLDHFSRVANLEQADNETPARIVALYPGVVDTDMQDTIRRSPAEAFPLLERFIGLKQDGQLTAPAVAAAKIIDFLDSAAFGDTPVVDIREL